MRRTPAPPRRRSARARAFAVVTVLLAALLPALVATPAHAMPVADLATARWIWYPEGEPAVSAPVATRYLRRTFTVPSGAVSDAHLVITGDDAVDVWLNGSYLAGSPRVTHSWKQALYVDLSAALRSGANTLAVAVRNSSAGPAGLLGRLSVTTAGGTVDLVTDTAWKAAQSAGESWTDPGFADGGWVAARDLGDYGVEPWYGNVAAPDPAAAAPVTVTGLTTQRRDNPVGVDAARPRFGWRLESSATRQVQGP